MRGLRDLLVRRSLISRMPDVLRQCVLRVRLMLRQRVQYPLPARVSDEASGVRLGLLSPSAVLDMMDSEAEARMKDRITTCDDPWIGSSFGSERFELT